MNVVHVAVGVLIDDAGRVLITRRADDAHQGGLWEFPGGKVEAGESVLDALDRELQEELGAAVLACEPLLEIRHDYSDKSVLLDIHRVTQWQNEPRGLEGQPLAWVSADELEHYEFPEANVPIVAKLKQL